MPDQANGPAQSPILYANEISLTFSENECLLRFSVQNQPQATGNHVAMTLKTAKLLGQMLTLIITDFEKKTGQEIPLDPSRLDSIKEMLGKSQKKSSGPTHA